MQEKKKGLFDTGVLLKLFLGDKEKDIVRMLLDSHYQRDKGIY